MIKINLASLKQSILASHTQVGPSSGGNESQGTLADLGFGSTIRKPTLADVKSLPLKPILVGLVSYLLGSYFIDMTKSEQIDKLQSLWTKVDAENKQLKSKIEKGKQLQELKIALESDEKVIKTKLDLIKKLMGDRKTATDVIAQIAKTLPAEVWLTDLTAKGNEKDLDLSIKGSSLGFNQISDFMKNLNESVLFKEVQLGSTQQSKDDKGIEFYQFDLNLKKK